jgi:hypothetical protein
MFSLSQYQEITAKLAENPHSIRLRQTELQVKAQRLADEWYIPEPVAETIIEIMNLINSSIDQTMATLELALDAVTAPWTMWEKHDGWQALRGTATGVAADVNLSTLGSTGSWTGAAAAAYTRAIPPQSAAAARLGSIAGKAQGVLAMTAITGLVFYAAVLAEVVQVSIALVTADAATDTGVGAPAGLLVALGGSAKCAATLSSLVAALLTFLGAQALALSDLQSEAAEMTAFPFGHWPQAVDV